MGKTEISITYQNNRVVYAPGDVVKGSIILELKKPKKVKKVKVNTIGESAVKLKTPDGKQLRNNEKYFHYTFDVYTGGDTELNTGKHNFPFQVTLPAALPTSFEGKFGYVRYSVHADVEYQGIFAGKSKNTSAFTVLDMVDLNTMSSSRTIQRMHCEKAASGALWWRKNAVTVDLATEKTGYVPGEFIYMNGLIVNGRSKPIRHVTIELWQQVTFHGRVKNSAPNSALQKHDVSSAVATWSMDKNGSPISDESAANWERKKLFQIPPLIPSGLRSCKIINVQYYLKVTVIVPGSVSSSTIVGKSNHITIGTVPLMAPQQQQQFQATTAAAASAPPMEMPPEPSAPPPYDPGNSAFANVPLPSYEEAITGGASLAEMDNSDTISVMTDSPDAVIETNASSAFVPQYAFFDFSQTATNTTGAVPSAPPADL